MFIVIQDREREIEQTLEYNNPSLYFSLII